MEKLRIIFIQLLEIPLKIYKNIREVYCVFLMHLLQYTFRSIYFNKFPVHLVILTRTYMISSASVSLWTYNLSWCWNQIFICSNISFDRSFASWITDFLKFFKYNFRICDVLSEIIVNCTFVSWNNRFPGIFSFMLARVYVNMSSRSLLLIFNLTSFIWCVSIYQCRTVVE